MIYYICESPIQLGVFLVYDCGPLSQQVRFLDYQTFFRLRQLRGGVVILTDLSLIGRDTLERAARYYDVLNAPESPVRVLNHPLNSLRRFQLLRRLYERGINRFNVYRLDEDRSACRFPVFVRLEKSHEKNAILTDLIQNEAELTKALHEIRARNIDPAALMIVEFIDARGPDGYFRKYGAYRVGDVIYGQHCFFRESWFVKHVQAFASDAHRAEHLEYFATNPHADQLRPIFDIAGVEYGRVDYAVVDGCVQVFEINSNPTVLTEPPFAAAYDTHPYAERHERAMETLLAYGDAERTIEIPDHLRLPGPEQRTVDQIHRLALRLVQERVKQRYLAL